MPTISAAGTTVAIASGAPATYDAAGFAAQTFLNIGKIKTGPEFGKTFEVISNNYLSQRGTEKRKGTWNGGQLSLEVDSNQDDTGQALAETAVDDDADYSFRVTLQDGTVYYLRGLVVSFPLMTGSPNDMVRYMLTVELNPIFDGDDEYSSIKVLPSSV